jgi:hypothetical protein
MLGPRDKGRRFGQSTLAGSKSLKGGSMMLVYVPRYLIREWETVLMAN